MWGIRALRVCAALALLATAGCCERCQNVWKCDTKSAPPAQEKDEPAAYKSNHPRGGRGGWFDD
ncbi:MAG: hypothetical protein FJ304_13425 [Planctomycetes bacterium]|nr:hypothetical protein [Planctomycetota bacterium]